MTFSALLDTCVLVPSFQRDILLELATRGAFRAIWSDKIEEELSRVLLRLRHGRGVDEDVSKTYVKRLLEQMNKALPDARVLLGDSAVKMGSCGLPDPDDQHIVDAAVFRSCRCDSYKQYKGLSSKLFAFESISSIARRVFA